MEFIALVFVLLIILTIGILFYNGKCGFLVSGYNMLSKEEKAKYDEKSLLRFMSYILFIVDLLVLLTIVGVHFNMQWISTFSSVMIFIVTIFACIYSNTGNRFKKNSKH